METMVRIGIQYVAIRLHYDAHAPVFVNTEASAVYYSNKKRAVATTMEGDDFICYCYETTV